MNQPVRIRDIRHVLPLAGRVRAGKKIQLSNGKVAPVRLRTFRFTSPDRSSIEKVAQLYGGDVEPWNDPMAAPNQWQVETGADEIAIALPPDPLGDSWYEHWAGNGCARRCDGDNCTLNTGAGPEGTDPMDVPCVCARRGYPKGHKERCKLTTRLSVILPDVRFLGVWRLDTKGETAAEELPGMAELIQALQGRGINRAILRLEERVRRTPAGKRVFVVPMLGMDTTPNEIAAGHVPQLATFPTTAEIGGCPGCESVFNAHLIDCPFKIPELGEAHVLQPDEVIQLTEHAGAQPGPTDPEMVQAWKDSLSTAQQAKLLLKARISERARGVEQSTTWAEVTLEVADELSRLGS